MPNKRLTQEEAQSILDVKLPHIKICKWNGIRKGNNYVKSDFLDTDTNEFFESQWYPLLKEITVSPKKKRERRQKGTEKAKVTILEKYGVESHNQLEEVKEKKKKSFQEKYNVNWGLQSVEVQEKIKQSYRDSYGVDYPSQVSSIKEKQKQAKILTGKTRTFRGKTVPEIAKERKVPYSTLRHILKNNSSFDPHDYSKHQTSLESKLAKILNIEKSNVCISDIRPDFLIDNVVIEANGLYWHSDKILTDPKHHLIRREKLENLGYRVLQFNETEIHQKPEIVKSIVCNTLKQNKHHIYGRNTNIKELNKKEANLFFEGNHLMGKGCGRCFCLVFNDDIVMAVRVINKTSHLEINRLCSRLHTTVVGGFSKLLSKLKREYPRKKIETFIDRNYGTGSYLESLGFTRNKTFVSFKWVNPSKLEIFHRMTFKGNTGYENGYYKLWDAGQTRYTLLPEN